MKNQVPRTRKPRSLRMICFLKPYKVSWPPPHIWPKKRLLRRQTKTIPPNIQSGCWPNRLWGSMLMGRKQLCTTEIRACCSGPLLSLPRLRAQASSIPVRTLNPPEHQGGCASDGAPRHSEPQEAPPGAWGTFRNAAILWRLQARARRFLPTPPTNQSPKDCPPPP